MFFTYYILIAKNKEKSDKSFPVHLLFLTHNYQNHIILLWKDFFFFIFPDA